MTKPILIALLAVSAAAQTAKPNLPGDKPCPAAYHFAYVGDKLVCAPRTVPDKRTPKIVPRIQANGDLRIPETFIAQNAAKLPTPAPKPEVSGITMGTGWTTVSSPEPPADLSVSNATDAKTGVHTITISDPDNHWRCVVTSTVPVHPVNPLHTEISAFTMTCFDATGLDPVPAKSK